MYQLLAKMIESRKQKEKLSDRQKHDCFVFFANLFTEQFPLEFSDSDIAALAHHLWPPRISEVNVAESFCRDAALQAVGHRCLLKQCAIDLSNSPSKVTLRWTDGLIEDIDKSRCRNVLCDTLSRSSALNGFVNLLRSAFEEQGAAKDGDKQRILLISLVKAHKAELDSDHLFTLDLICLLYTSPSPRDLSTSRMPSSA